MIYKDYHKGEWLHDATGEYINDYTILPEWNEYGLAIEDGTQFTYFFVGMYSFALWGELPKIITGEVLEYFKTKVYPVLKAERIRRWRAMKARAKRAEKWIGTPYGRQDNSKWVYNPETGERYEELY